MENFYKDLPMMPYKKTSVPMADVILYLEQLNIPIEVKRATYLIFRNESANGNSGVCNNYIGFQSDSGRWQSEYDKYLVGVCVKSENRTGKERGFLCFSKWQDSVDILAKKVTDRGLYIGGLTHKITQQLITNKNELAIAYQREWVTGNSRYVPTQAELSNFTSMYAQSVNLF